MRAAWSTRERKRGKRESEFSRFFLSARIVPTLPSPRPRPLLSFIIKKNIKNSARYCRAFRFQTTFPSLGPCDVTFTSVAGHLFELDFVGEARSWRGVDPASLYTAPVVKRVREENKPVERNLHECARNADTLVLWLDCDREGENIAFEVIDACRSANPRLSVLRARFSSLSAPEIARAVSSLGPPNEADARAVDARQEIDLRVGASFTRLQTLMLQDKFDWDAIDDAGNGNDENFNPQQQRFNSNGGSSSSSKLISYGPCQFPTLGLIVSRCWEARAHVPESFWYLHLVLPGGGNGSGSGSSGSGGGAAPRQQQQLQNQPRSVSFKWARGQLFDHGIAAALYEAAVGRPNEPAAAAASPAAAGAAAAGAAAPISSAADPAAAATAVANTETNGASPPSRPPSISAVITSVDGRRRHREPPAPLSTLELQKAATRRNVLGLPGDRVMKLAEELYQQGYLSYPRTETDEFDRDFDLTSLIQMQCDDPRWGPYARRLSSGELWRFPRSGGHNDKAHPPIHPTKCVNGDNPPADWCNDKRRLYEFVTRSFLAACSRPAEGAETRVEAAVGHERFWATGLMVTDWAWLDVYPYTSWGGAGELPTFVRGQWVVPLELTLRSGATQPPPRLAEADLLAAMDRHGIGTDATMVDHIKTLLTRKYAVKESSSNGTDGNDGFSPTPLGEALVSGYASLGLEGLWQPQLRARIEGAIRAIASGAVSKEKVLADARAAFERDFAAARAGAGALVEEVARFFPRFGGGGGRGGAGGGAAAATNNGNGASAAAAAVVVVGPCCSPGCRSYLILKHAPADPAASSFGGGYFECSAAPLCTIAVALPPGTKVTSLESETAAAASCCSTCGASKLSFAFRRAAIPAGFDTRMVACGTPGCDRTLRALLAACGELRVPFARRGGGGGGVGVGGNASGGRPATTTTTMMPQWRAPPPPPPPQARAPRRNAAASAPSTSQPAAAATAAPRRRNAPAATANAAAPLLCPAHCLPLLQLTAHSGANAGRRFLKCSVEEDRGGCLEFAWADEHEGGEGGGGNANGSGSGRGRDGRGRARGAAAAPTTRGRGRGAAASRRGGDSTNSSSTRFVSATGGGAPPGMSCFNCGAPGHFSNACPNR